MIVFKNIFTILMFIHPILLLTALRDIGALGKLNCTEIYNKTSTNFPNIKVSNFDSPLLTSSKSQLESFPLVVPTALRSLELECSASYPVVWGFAGKYPYITWDTDTKRRLASNSSEEEFVSTITFNSLRIFDLEHRLPTCYNARDKCLQATLVGTKQFSTPNDTVLLNFTKGLGLPIERKQIVSNNQNCTIKFGYDERTQRFYCYTTTGEIPEILFSSCSNSVTCNALMSPTNCSIQPEISIGNCTEENSCRIASLMVDYVPSVAKCVSSEKEINVAYIHYFYSFPIRNNSFRHFKWADARPEDMLAISHSESGNIYCGENVTISCNASYYYFSSGLKLRIEGEHYARDFRNEDKVIKIPSPKNGNPLQLNRSVLLTERMPKPGKYQITCSAPVWNSSAWISKNLTISVLPSEIPKIFGGNETQLINYKPNMTIKCEASGTPKTILNWLWNGTQVISDSLINYGIRYGGNESYSWSELHFPNLEDNILENVTCLAQNCIGKDSKDFHLSSIDDKSPIIFAVIIVSIFFVVVVAGLIWQIVSTRGNHVLTKAEWNDFMKGKKDYVPVNSEKNIAHMNDISEYLPYDKSRLEISREDLLIDRGTILGMGAYGVVWKADIKDRNISQANGETYRSIIETDGHNSFRPVAVKTLRKDSPFDGKNFKALLSELKILSYIKSHQHIIQLVGAVTTNIMKGKVYIALELCENGSLLDHIRGNRRIYTLYETGGYTYYSPSQSTSGNDYSEFMDSEMCLTLTKSQTLSKLMLWAFQITDAMEYLTSIKIVHGDLGLRNILLSKNWEVKITDFGLSHKLDGCKNYIGTAPIPLPLKWLAIECLQYSKCYLESDVWSFGITLWEILSLGETPYSGMEMESMTPSQFLKELEGGKRLCQPPLATPQIYEIMKSCWHEDFKRRPTFESLKKFIRQCLDEQKNEWNSKNQILTSENEEHVNYSNIQINSCSTNNTECNCIDEVDNVTNCSKL